MIAKKIRAYFYGIQHDHFWPRFITFILVAVCYTSALVFENPEARKNSVLAGFFWSGVLGLKKDV